MTIDVKFNDHQRKATEKPNPKYPNGVDIDLRETVIAKSCTRNLPYPAPGCGTYSVLCRTCGWSGLVTVAGRTDDPRTITIPCKARLNA